MFCALKKTIGVVLIGIGLGILLVLLLPLTGWLFIIGVALACVGLMWLACLIKEGVTYDYSCKKSSKVFTWICKIHFWN